MNAASQEAVPLYITLPIVVVFFLSLAVIAYWLWHRKTETLAALAKAKGLKYTPDFNTFMPIPKHSNLRRTPIFGTAADNIRADCKTSRSYAIGPPETRFTVT